MHTINSFISNTFCIQLFYASLKAYASGNLFRVQRSVGDPLPSDFGSRIQGASERMAAVVAELRSGW
jgi:hypothetical protein